MANETGYIHEFCPNPMHLYFNPIPFCKVNSFHLVNLPMETINRLIEGYARDLTHHYDFWRVTGDWGTSEAQLANYLHYRLSDIAGQLNNQGVDGAAYLDYILENYIKPGQEKLLRSMPDCDQPGNPYSECNYTNL